MARASAAQLPFPDGRFDLVTSFDVLYSLPDQVESRVGKGELRGRGPRHPALPLGARVLKSGPCQVDTVSTAVFPEHMQVVPGTAAAVQDDGTDPTGSIGDQRFDEPPEAAEPEVVALGARGGLE